MQVVLYNSRMPRFYYSTDEGATWIARALSPSTINPRSLVWNPTNDRMALAHDSNNDHVLPYHAIVADASLCSAHLAVCYSRLGSELDQDSRLCQSPF